MVDMEAILGELKRTAYVGIGTFGSAMVGDFLADVIPGGDMAVAAGQYAVGSGVAFISVDRLDARQTRGLKFDMGEAARHAGYGVGGAGFAELADVVRGDTAAGAQDVISVRTRSNASSAQTGQQASQVQSQNEEELAFSVDV